MSELAHIFLPLLIQAEGSGILGYVNKAFSLSDEKSAEDLANIVIGFKVKFIYNCQLILLVAVLIRLII